ncbi:MAG: family 16 glycosylhydrolase [Hyphomonadaceae bacterium]
MLAAAALLAAAQTAGAQRLDRSNLTPTFNDDFLTFSWDEKHHGAGPNAGVWRTAYMNGWTPNDIHNRTLPGNRELQVYLDKAFPEMGAHSLGVHPYEILEGGVLRITANPAPAAMRRKIWNRKYTSGMITSWGSFAQRYGVFEIRARMPAGKGLWPAFWMLNQAGGWPPEIDVFEIIGQDPTSVFSAVHSAEKGEHTGAGKATTVADTADFHTYSVDWGPKDIIFYFDDEETWRHKTPADLHEPMFLIVNLAVGGKWPGAPDARTVFPAHLDVDWVRAWQRSEYIR